jgi:hypothetical protein
MLDGITKVAIMVRINTAHCLLWNRNEDSMHKGAQELGWVLTCGMM